MCIYSRLSQEHHDRTIMAQRLHTKDFDPPSVVEVTLITNQGYYRYSTAIAAQVCEPALDRLEAGLKKKIKIARC